MAPPLYLVGPESEPAAVSTDDGGCIGSAGVGGAPVAAASAAPEGPPAWAGVAAVADMALLTASTRTHSAASSWQMAISKSSMPVQAWNSGEREMCLERSNEKSVLPH